ncbi:hypothetical protein D3C76_1625840 [compost metagenome]
MGLVRQIQAIGVVAGGDPRPEVAVSAVVDEPAFAVVGKDDPSPVVVCGHT